MICPNCGANLSDNARFCTTCGKPIQTAGAATETSANGMPVNTTPANGMSANMAPVNMMPANATPMGAAPVNPAQAKVAPTQPKKKKGKAGIIAAAAIGAVAVAGGVTGVVLWNNDGVQAKIKSSSGDKLYEKKDLEGAVEQYKLALEKSEDSKEAIKGLLNVAKSYLKSKNYKDALEMYELVLEYDSEESKALDGRIECNLALAKEAMNKEQYEDAGKYFEAALKGDKKNAEALSGQVNATLGLGLQCLDNHDYSKALEYFERILNDPESYSYGDSRSLEQAQSGCAIAYLEMGRSSFRSGAYADADRYFNKILTNTEVGAEAYLGLAEVYVAQDNRPGAISLLQQGLYYYADSNMQNRLEELQVEQQIADCPYQVLKDENGNVYDLGGREFKIYAWWWEDDSVYNDYSEARYEYREWAMETYNFRMEWSGAGDWGENVYNLADLALGGIWSTDGELRAYVVPGGQGAVMAAIKEGLVWDLTELGVIDFSEQRYAVNGITDMYSIDGHVYGFAAGYPEPRAGIFFNKDLLQQTTGMTADDLYDLQASNQWTWAKFEEICEKIYAGGDVDNDGVQDIYAIAGNSGSLQSYFCISNNVEMFPCRNGQFEYNAENPAVVEAFAEFLKVLRADYWYPQPYIEGVNNWDYFYSAFDEEGKIVFLPEEAYHINPKNRMSAIQDEDAEDYIPNSGEYGFLMFPIGPNANGRFINGYTDNIIVIPKCYNEEEAKAILAAYDIWYAPVPGFETYNERLDGYEPGCYDSRELNETLARMMSEGAFVRSPGVPGINVGDDTGWWPAGFSAEEMIAMCADKWGYDIDNANH